jgi:hypothetical protein
MIRRDNPAMGHSRRRSSPLRMFVCVVIGGAIAVGGWWLLGMPQIRVKLDSRGLPTKFEWVPTR